MQGYVTGTVSFLKFVGNSLLVRNRTENIGSICWNKVVVVKRLTLDDSGM